MSDLEEKSLRSEKLFDGVLLKVYRDHVELQDSSESVREWIDHPGASAVVPLFEDGSTILVRQYRFPPRREFLEVPAGKIDVVGESPLEVAKRELEEETGWRAGKVTQLASLYPCIGYSNEIIHIYLAEELVEGVAALSDGEMLECVRLSFHEAVQMSGAGQILDMKTMSALALADAFLKARAAKV